MDDWIRDEYYYFKTGESKDSVSNLIRKGYWIEKLHWKRDDARRLWIDYEAVKEWILIGSKEQLKKRGITQAA